MNKTPHPLQARTRSVKTHAASSLQIPQIRGGSEWRELQRLRVHPKPPPAPCGSVGQGSGLPVVAFQPAEEKDFRPFREDVPITTLRGTNYDLILHTEKIKLRVRRQVTRGQQLHG